MLRRKAGAGELGVNLDALAQYLGGTITSGNTITFPGPGHSREDRSASVTFTDDAWNGIFKTYSYASRDEVPLIERIVCEALDDMGWSGETVGKPNGEKDKLARARWMWGFGRDARGTVVERYLERRGVRLPPGEEIAYWRHGYFGANRSVPLMLCRVRSIESDELIAVHRTALTLEGEKAYHDIYGNMDCRAFAGSPKGGAIKILPLGKRLGVGEGVETTLSLREFRGCRDLPVWSLMSDIGLGKLPVLEGVEELIVAEDNDQGGIVAAAEVAARWRKAGRKVTIVGTRGIGGNLNDLNDLVRSRKHGEKEEGPGGRGLE